MKLFARASCLPIYVISIALSASLSAAELSIRIVENNAHPVHDTVVELIGTDIEPALVTHLAISQVDKEYIPELSIIPRGSNVTFLNKDPFKHHVYSVSKGNDFDLPLYEGEPAEQITFNTPGVVKMGCNIHDWMLAFAYISQSERVETTDASGLVVFKDLAPGQYQLNVWNPRLRNNKKVISQSISIQDDQNISKEVKLKLRNKVRKKMRNEDESNYNK